MFRTLSTTLLTLCLVPASASLAQNATTADAAPPPPPHRGGMGRMGPGGFMPGMLGRGPAPIANAPFSATFTSSANMQGRDGQQVQRSSTRTVYRDSMGRTREDVTLPPPPPRTPAAGDQAAAPPATPDAAPHVMTVIVDPVANTITRLNPERKTAIVETVPADFFKRAQERPASLPEGARRHGADASVTDLGSKTIAGVVAQGKRTTRTMPGPDGASDRSMTRETWFAPDLKLEVSETDTTPRGMHSEVVTSLTKAEPPAALFKVPEGYATRQAPERSFHHGEHDGPGAPPPDGPPPAM